MNNSFQKLNDKEQIVMAQILAKAFCHHDNFVYLIEDEEKRLNDSFHLFRFMTRVVNEYGYIFVVYQNNEPVGYVTFMDDFKAKMGVKTVLGAKALGYAARFWFRLTLKERKKYKKYIKAYNKENKIK